MNTIRRNYDKLMKPKKETTEVSLVEKKKILELKDRVKIKGINEKK